MTSGGPLNSSLVYVLYIFRRAFENFRMGYASALAVILFLIVLVFTIVLFKFSRYWVHTEVD
jgi:multiple sugar transport system permease protein